MITSMTNAQVMNNGEYVGFVTDILYLKMGTDDISRIFPD